MHNSDAVTPASLTPPVRACSGGATARSGGDTTGNDDSINELRNEAYSGCPSFSEPQGTYLDVAESRGSAEQCRRRWTAAALMAIPRSSRPGPPNHARNIKMGPTRSTDTAGGRNRAERDSPAAEKTNSENGRKGDSPKSALACTGETKINEAKASPR